MLKKNARFVIHDPGPFILKDFHVLQIFQNKTIFHEHLDESFDRKTLKIVF